jgi:hypothetical protein
MCDFSLQHAKSRPAVVADKLVSHNFGRWSADDSKGLEGFTTAIFRQRDKDKPSVHHDVLEMPDGQQILLTHLEEGQTATVLQLPSAPRTDAEAEEQTRAEYAG